MFSKKQFWNKKILSWEKNKYEKKSKLYDVNFSIKHRLNLASSILHQIPKKKTVLELGCGSGQLWEKIKLLDLNYKGVDFCETAINIFQKRIQNVSIKKKIFLFCENCEKTIHSTDIVISLGLLDWLSIKQIAQIAENYKNSWYIHSFSEKNLSFSQLLHKFYVYINYAHKTKSYYPNYYKAEELLNIFNKCNQSTKIFRHPKLTFGALIYNLPNYIKFKI